MKKLLILIAVLLLFAGCPRRKNYVKEHPELSKYKKSVILRGKIIIGMSKDEVRASWGRPTNVSYYRTGLGTISTWCYDYQLVYFKNGYVTGWSN